jgi:hypothetical protein
MANQDFLISKAPVIHALQLLFIVPSAQLSIVIAINC